MFGLDTLAYMYIAAALIAAGSAYYAHEQGVEQTNRAIDAAAEEQEYRNADAKAAQQLALENQSSQISERALEAQRELSFLQAASNEYGGGASANRLMTIAGDDANRDIATIRSNTSRELVQLSRGNAADLAAYRSRLDILRSNAPSRTGTLLKIGGTAASSYTGYQGRKPG